MKKSLNIINGIIGSGKTKFINNIINTSYRKDERVLVLQFEKGKSKIIKLQNVVDVIDLNKEKFNLQDLIQFVNNEDIDRVIIELNAMKDFAEIISLLKSKECREVFKLDNTITLIDYKTFKMFYSNMGLYLEPLIRESETLIFTNKEEAKNGEVKKIKKIIYYINPNINVYMEDTYSDKNTNSFYRMIVTLLMFGILFFLVLNLYKISRMYNIDLNILKEIYVKFVSMLLETLPFIIIGAFFSGIIQVFISEEQIINTFKKGRLISSFTAVGIGFFLPICDCGIIPIARGLIKKGIDISAIITFLIAAPIVNPIAILATIIALGSSNTEIIVLRVILGIAVAIVVGQVLGRSGFSNKDVRDEYYCNCSSCKVFISKGESFIKKLSFAFSFIVDEFINIGSFVVLGVFISSTMQTLLNIEMFKLDTGNLWGNILIILIFSSIFSVCSTSDVFIARGFIEVIPKGTVLGYLILGPLFSIKNIMILFSSFKGKFVYKLLSITFIFTVLILITMGLL